MQEDNEEFWIGWDSALDGVEAALKTMFSIPGIVNRSKPADIILDIENTITEMRLLQPTAGLTIFQ